MILYCDTSALLKLYLTEAGSAEVARCLAESEGLAVCRIAWAEAHAAFARRVREVPRDALVIDAAKQALALDWQNFIVFEIDQTLVELAADYADTFALRGYDSVQLAAAASIGQITGVPTLFACFDTRLNKAAKVLGLMVL
jgi:predicted nucleic acid-binding protein